MARAVRDTAPDIQGMASVVRDTVRDTAPDIQGMASVVRDTVRASQAVVAVVPGTDPAALVTEGVSPAPAGGGQMMLRAPGRVAVSAVNARGMAADPRVTEPVLARGR